MSKKYLLCFQGKVSSPEVTIAMTSLPLPLVHPYYTTMGKGVISLTQLRQSTMPQASVIERLRRMIHLR